MTFEPGGELRVTRGVDAVADVLEGDEVRDHREVGDAEAVADEEGSGRKALQIGEGLGA